MNLLAPLALAALLVVPAIYLVHLLHGSRRRVVVPALFLWRDLPRASAGRRRRHWPPISLLLVLQLLAGGLAAAALARPALSSDPPRHLVLALDASASMQATDVAPSRFAAARALALDRLARLASTDTVSVVRAGSEALLLASGSPDSVRPALSAMQPGLSGSAIREAVALASTQVASTPERRGQIVVFSDVAWLPLQPIGSLDAPVEVVPVGGGAENQSVGSLVVRMDPSGRGQTAFVEVDNTADQAVRVPFRLTADDSPIDQRDLDLPARGLTRLSVPLPVEAHTIGVRLLGRDALAMDDSASTVAPGGPPRDVLLIGRASPSLQRAIESIPSLRVQVVDAVGPNMPRADVTVLDGIFPSQLPPGPLLLVDPPASSVRLVGVGLGSAAREKPAHPLMAGLDLSALRGETPTITGVPAWANVVLGNLQGPLVLEGRIDNRPVVAFTFDPSLSGLEKSLAFPLLISNATSFLLAPPPVAGEVFDHTESDIRPRAAPVFDAAGQQLSAGGWVERWPWLVAGVLALLGVEWLVFARRG